MVYHLLIDFRPQRKNDVSHYQRAIEIQQRLEAVLELVAAEQYSTPQIACEIDVSTATVSRCIDALRKQGHSIESVKIDGQWCYRLHGSSQKGSSKLAKAGKS
ncbi:HTH domain-containing protein [Rhodopirellula bahusiensis]|uniref:HTH domain-containing protein n=1 Tax=Rhodopirellula bahusiensis TaxID=2014065 RepID=UPI0036F33140